MEASAEEKIRELLEVAKAHHLAEMAYQENGLRVAFRRSPLKRSAAAPKTAVNGSAAAKNGSAAAPATSEEIIKSPMVGTFRRSLSKDHPPMVVEGNHVKPGDKIGVVECMKIPNEVVAYAEGYVSKILVEDGHAVEYGQPLFSLSPSKPGSSGSR